MQLPPPLLLPLRVHACPALSPNKGFVAHIQPTHDVSRSWLPSTRMNVSGTHRQLARSCSRDSLIRDGIFCVLAGRKSTLARPNFEPQRPMAAPNAEAEAFKAQGNAALSAQKFDEAAAFYTKVSALGCGEATIAGPCHRCPRPVPFLRA